jgi:hypothetical protein
MIRERVLAGLSRAGRLFVEHRSVPARLSKVLVQLTAPTASISVLFYQRSFVMQFGRIEFAGVAVSMEQTASTQAAVEFRARA